MERKRHHVLQRCGVGAPQQLDGGVQLSEAAALLQLLLNHLFQASDSPCGPQQHEPVLLLLAMKASRSLESRLSVKFAAASPHPQPTIRGLLLVASCQLR